MSNESAAIMFSDVSGSSRLFKLVGDEQARSIISRVVAMMMEKTEAQKGTVIKTIGDEVMASFPTAQQALDASVTIQNDIDTTDYGAPLSIHIGFVYGAVIEEDGDVYGEAVNDAAALVKVAKGGQIITSSHTRKSLPVYSQHLCQGFDEIRIKGGTDTELIYFVKWQADEVQSNATMFLGADISTEVARPVDTPNEITLAYQGENICLSTEDMPYSIGRGEAANLTVYFNLASREHCTIDYRHGKFVLVDKSTNGTHVVPDGRSQIYLRRESTPLEGAGVFSFSPDCDVDGPHLIRYTCST